MTVIWLAVAAAPGAPGVPGAPGAPGVPATPGDPAWLGACTARSSASFFKTKPVQSFTSCLCTASLGGYKPQSGKPHESR